MKSEVITFKSAIIISPRANTCALVEERTSFHIWKTIFNETRFDAERRLSLMTILIARQVRNSTATDE